MPIYIKLATAFFMEALRSNISIQISVSCLIIYFCGKQPCNKQGNVHPASFYCKIKMYVIPYL